MVLAELVEPDIGSGRKGANIVPYAHFQSHPEERIIEAQRCGLTDNMSVLARLPALR